MEKVSTNFKIKATSGREMGPKEPEGKAQIRMGSRRGKNKDAIGYVMFCFLSREI